MSDEEIRIAIAKALGWTNIDKYLGREPLPFTREFLGGTNDGCPETDDTLGHEIKRIPDYPNDLNAMHEAEKALNRNDDLRWAGYLMDITGEDLAFVALRKATARQRAEAFLRTLNLWKD